MMCGDKNSSYQNIYAGFTIGPICDVMKHARKTREMWFGSYFFSWYMEKLERELQKNNEITFLTPFIEKKENDRRAGLYPDRFVIKSDLSKDEIEKLIENANTIIRQFFVDIISRLGSLPGGKVTFTNQRQIDLILREYLQTQWVTVPADGIQEKDVIGIIWNYLDAKEEHRHFKLGKSKNTCDRCHTLPSVATAIVPEKAVPIKLCPLCLLKYFSVYSNEVTNKIKNFHRYPSTGEISAVELVEPFRENNDEYKEPLKSYIDKYDEIEFDDKKFIRIIEQSPKICCRKIKPYDKYIAILNADGDGMGELSKTVSHPIDFSKKLFIAGIENYKICQSYSGAGFDIGEPVYIGGDDVLAFLPVAYHTSEKNITTIIDVALALNAKFKEELGPGAGLSIGISVAYYKHPLVNTLEKSREMLFGIAKNQEGKDTLVIHLKKHSGNNAQIVFSFKESERLEEFNRLLKSVLLSEEDLMGSIHYNLLRFEKLLACIESKEQLTNFFDNNFSEQKKAGFSGIDHVQKMFEIALGLTSVAIPASNREKAVDGVLKQLWFIKFLVGKEEE